MNMTSNQAAQQLILLSAGTAARRRAMEGRAEQLMREVDLRKLAELLYLRRLLPTLGPRLIELAQGEASDEFSEVVRHSIERERRHGAFLQLVSLRATALLTDAGISSLPLKGALLAERIYGDPGRRPAGDIDLLVPTERLHDAVEVVRTLGYGAPTDHVDHRGLPQLHFLLVHEEQKLPPIELHWRVHWYERAFARERLLPSEEASTNNWQPSLADELTALLLFYARDGFVDLRLATDLGAWWDKFGPDLPLGALDELRTSYPAFARVLPVAVRVAEIVVGLPAERLITEISALGVRDRLAVRLANPNPTASQSQLYADIGFIDGLLTPWGEFITFLRRQVVLPRALVREYARRFPNFRARSPADYALRVLARYAFAMARALRTPGIPPESTIATTPRNPTLKP